MWVDSNKRVPWCIISLNGPIVLHPLEKIHGLIQISPMHYFCSFFLYLFPKHDGKNTCIWNRDLKRGLVYEKLNCIWGFWDHSTIRYMWPFSWKIRTRYTHDNYSIKLSFDITEMHLREDSLYCCHLLEGGLDFLGSSLLFSFSSPSFPLSFLPFLLPILWLLWALEAALFCWKGWPFVMEMVCKLELIWSSLFYNLFGMVWRINLGVASFFGLENAIGGCEPWLILFAGVSYLLQTSYIP